MATPLVNNKQTQKIEYYVMIYLSRTVALLFFICWRNEYVNTKQIIQKAQYKVRKGSAIFIFILKKAQFQGQNVGPK